MQRKKYTLFIADREATEKQVLAGLEAGYYLLWIGNADTTNKADTQRLVDKYKLLTGQYAEAIAVVEPVGSAVITFVTSDVDLLVFFAEGKELLVFSGKY